MQLIRPRPPLAVLCHIIHRTVTSRGKPVFQMRRCGREVEVADADLGKSQIPAPLPDAAGEGGVIDSGRMIFFHANR